MPGYTIVWRFRVHQDHRAEFEKAYGPDGDWAQFFHAGEGYRGTHLLRSHEAEGEYLTLDWWISEEAYRKFRDEHRAQYEELDRRCERLTQEETPLGTFDT